MGRNVEDAPITTPAARRRLAPRRKPYWRAVQRGLHVGYRRLSTLPGTWVIRIRTAEGYREHRLPLAPDDLHAEGTASFDRAVKSALAFSTGPDEDPLTILQALNEWAKAKEIAGQRDQTARATRAVVNVIAKDWPGVRVADLTAARIEDWRDGLVRGDTPESRRKARNTANRKLSTLRAALSRAAERRGITEQPWRKVKPFPKKDSFGRRVVTLTEAQFRATMQRAARCPALANLLVAGWSTGARLGELIDARVSDWGVSPRRMALSGKTGNRVITLSAEADALFSRLAQDRAPDAPLLANPSGARWQETALRYYFLDVFEKPATFYALRHSYISRKLVEGVPVVAIAQQVGNSVSQIEDSYAHFMPHHQDVWFG